MPFFFDVYGSFAINRTGNSIRANQCELWDIAEQSGSGLSNAIGCYMFCIKYGNSLMPWYVGKTICKRGFSGEVFTPHKLNHYSKSMKKRSGDPILFLFPLLSVGREQSRFSRNRSQGARVIKWLEETIMVKAVEQNHELMNKRDLTLLRSVTVRGILGERSRGRPFNEVAEVRSALFGT